MEIIEFSKELQSAEVSHVSWMKSDFSIDAVIRILEIIGLFTSTVESVLSIVDWTGGIA